MEPHVLSIFKHVTYLSQSGMRTNKNRWREGAMHFSHNTTMEASLETCAHTVAYPHPWLRELWRNSEAGRVWGESRRINLAALRNPENVHQKRSEYSEAAGSVPVSESLSPSIRGTAIFVPPASNKGFTLSLQSAFMQRSVEASNYEAERRGGWGAVLRPAAAHLIIRC